MEDTTKTVYSKAPLTDSFLCDGVIADVGRIEVEWAPFGNSNITDDGTLGWYILGIPNGEIKPAHTIEPLLLKTGTPEKTKGLLKVGEFVEVPVTLESLTVKGKELITGSPIATVITDTTPAVATTIDETPPAATNFSVTVTSPTGFAVGDTIRIVTGSATYGTLEEVTKIEEIVGSVFSINPPISQLPADLATVAKVDNISWKAGGVDLPATFRLRLKYHFNNDRSIDIVAFKRAKIKTVDFFSNGDGKTPSLGGFVVEIIPVRENINGEDCFVFFTRTKKYQQ